MALALRSLQIAHKCSFACAGAWSLVSGGHTKARTIARSLFVSIAIETKLALKMKLQRNMSVAREQAGSTAARKSAQGKALHLERLAPENGSRVSIIDIKIGWQMANSSTVSIWPLSIASTFCRLQY